VRLDPRPECLAVGEAGVHGVLEVRVCVHEAGDERRTFEVPRCASGLDRDDPALLEAHESFLDRRAVYR
jgi:hypothetical protein